MTRKEDKRRLLSSLKCGTIIVLFDTIIYLKFIICIIVQKQEGDGITLKIYFQASRLHLGFKLK